MFLPISDSIAQALTEMEELRKISHRRKNYPESFEYFLGLELAKDKGKETELRRVRGTANLVGGRCQTAPPPGTKLLRTCWSGKANQPRVRRKPRRMWKSNRLSATSSTKRWRRRRRCHSEGDRLEEHGKLIWHWRKNGPSGCSRRPTGRSPAESTGRRWPALVTTASLFAIWRPIVEDRMRVRTACSSKPRCYLCAGEEK